MTWILGLSQIVLAGPEQYPTTDLLDASYGIIGREDLPILNAKEAYQCAEVAVSAIDWNLCGDLWQRQVEEQPLQSDADLAVMWSVVSYIRAGNYADAYTQLGILMPRAESIGWSVLVLESWLLNSLGGSKESIAILKHYPQKDPDYLGAQIVLLEAYNDKGKKRKAEKLEEQVISSGQADAWFWWWVSQTSESSDRELAFLQMVESQNATIFHYQETIRHFVFKGQLDLALKIGLNGIDRFSHSEKLRNQLVDIFHGERKQVLVDKVSKIPEHSQAQALLGAIYLAEKEYEKAEEHFSLAIQYGEEKEDIFEELAETQMLQGNEEEARQTIGLAVQKHPKNQKFWDEFWQLSQTTEEKMEFLESLNQAFVSKKSLPNALLKRGFEVSTNLQQKEQAITWADREIKQNNSWRAWSRKAQAFQENGQLDEAISAYEQALSIAPNNSFVLNNLAWLLIQPKNGQENDPQRALIYAQKAVEASKTPKAGFYDTLAAVLWVLDRHSEALQIQERAVELEPSNEDYLQKLQEYREMLAAE